MFPDLAEPAQNVFGISALSAASVRDVSSAEFIIQERRTQLNVSDFSLCVFTHGAGWDMGLSLTGVGLDLDSGCELYGYGRVQVFKNGPLQDCERDY